MVGMRGRRRLLIFFLLSTAQSTPKLSEVYFEEAKTKRTNFFYFTSSDGAGVSVV